MSHAPLATNVVITGVGRAGQVGEFIARSFAATGASVILLGHNEHDVEARAAELRANRGRAAAYACDLTDVDGVSAVAARVAREHGPQVSSLVNVAGGFAPSGPVADSEPAVLAAQIAINLTTAYVATRAFLPALRRSEGGAAVVFFASEAALPGANVSGIFAYAAAKDAVLVLMRAIAREEAPHGVRSNAVAPGTVRTTANVAAMPGGSRFVEREDVAAAVMFLCSDAARAVTGQVIRLTAGGR